MDIDFDEKPGNEKDFTFASIKDEASRIDICLCTGKETLMELCINDSRFVCPKCNSISKIENYSYIDQSNIKIKADSKALRVFNIYWLPIIAAEEWSVENDMSSKDLEEIIDELNFKNYSTTIAKKTLTCGIIRSIIKTRKLPNSLNQHVTKILLYFGVDLPYKPTHQETDIIFRWYLEAVNEYEKIKDSISNFIPGIKSRDNNITRPYYIYKIIDSVWKDNKNMRTLLQFIHLQHSKTVETNDLIWEKICENINLKYYPTERFL